MNQPDEGPIAAVAQVRARWEALRRAAHSQASSGSLTGWLWLREVQIDAHLGVSAPERQERQRLSVDLGLRVDVGAAAAADDLSATVDWAPAAGRLQQVADGRSWRLAETLALALAQDAMAHPGVLQAQCDLHKPGCLPSGRALVSIRLRGRPRGQPRRQQGRLGEVPQPIATARPTAAGGDPAAAPPPSLGSLSVLQIALQVTHLGQSLSFWRDLLGLQPLAGGDEPGQSPCLRLGGGALLRLLGPPAAGEPAAAAQPALVPTDVHLGVAPGDLGAWRDWLQQRGLTLAQTTPTTLVVVDPDGHRLVLSHLRRDR